MGWCGDPVFSFLLARHVSTHVMTNPRSILALTFALGTHIILEIIMVPQTLIIVAHQITKPQHKLGLVDINNHHIPA